MSGGGRFYFFLGWLVGFAFFFLSSEPVTQEQLIENFRFD